MIQCPSIIVNHTGQINNHNNHTSTSCDTGDIQPVIELGNVYVICDGNSDVNSDDYYPVDLVDVCEYGNVCQWFFYIHDVMFSECSGFMNTFIINQK